MINMMLIVAIVVVTTAVHGHSIGDAWTVYYPDAFGDNPLCPALDCSTHDVCVTKSDNAFCVKRNQLHQIHGLKVDARSGLLLDIDGGLKEATVDSASRHVESLLSADQIEQEVNDFHTARLQEHQSVDHTHPARERDDTEKYCNEPALKSMGGRLLQWFVDVHRAYIDNGTKKTVPPHHIVCAPSTAWMFTQWDANNDAELTVDELNSVENDPYERCVGAFLDQCDDNGDSALSLDEWCDCFAWAGADEHKEPACHSAKRKVDSYDTNAYHPSCTVDGFYRVEQCHGGHCWCVDKWGREFDRSRTVAKRADCGQYAEEEAKQGEL